MTNQFIENLNAVCDKLGIAIDWTSDNLMPQIQDLMTRYGRYLLGASIADLIICVSVTVLSFIAVRSAIRSYSKKGWAFDNVLKYGWSGIGFTCLAVGSIALVAGFFLSWMAVDNLIKAVTIPDIYAAQKLLELLQPQ